MALYSDKVMDHFQHPRNVGKLPDADGVGEVGNAKCGDIMRMYIQVDPETQVITDVKFKTFGCGSAIATSSMATEKCSGALFLPIKNHRPRLARPRTGSSPRTSSQTGADSSGRWASSDSNSSGRTKSYRRDIQRCREQR